MSTNHSRVNCKSHKNSTVFRFCEIQILPIPSKFSKESKCVGVFFLHILQDNALGSKLRSVVKSLGSGWPFSVFSGNLVMIHRKM
jgi:hypothetical protein